VSRRRATGYLIDVRVRDARCSVASVTRRGSDTQVRSALVVALLVCAPSAATARMTAAEVAGANARTIEALFDGLPAPPQPWNAIVFHHSATAGGSKARFDVGHRRKFNDPDGMEYHFLIGSGIGSPDGLIEVGDRWRRQIIAYHLFTRARDAGSIAICLVGNFELPASTPSKAQLAAATALARALAARYRIATDAMTTHRGIDGRLTQCPGKNFPLAAIKAAAVHGRADPRRRLAGRHRAARFEVGTFRIWKGWMCHEDKRVIHLGLGAGRAARVAGGGSSG